MDPYNGSWHIPHTTIGFEFLITAQLTFWIFSLPHQSTETCLFKVGMYKHILAQGLIGISQYFPIGGGPYLQKWPPKQMAFFKMAGDPSTNHFPIYPWESYIPPNLFQPAPEVPELCVRVAAWSMASLVTLKLWPSTPMTKEVVRPDTPGEDVPVKEVRIKGDRIKLVISPTYKSGIPGL